MKFSGRLQIEADPRNWLKTELSLNQARVELVSGDEILGSWSTAQVKAERLEGDRFQLQLGGDRAVFAADDALAFSYEALPVLSKKSVIAVATGLRGKLRKSLTGVDQVPAEPQAEPASRPEVAETRLHDDLVEASQTPQPTRRLRELIQEAVKSNAAEVAAHEPSPGWGREPAPPTVAPIDEVAHEVEIHFEPERLDPVWQPEGESSSSIPEPSAEMPAFLNPEPAHSHSSESADRRESFEPSQMSGPTQLARRRQFGLGESRLDSPIVDSDLAPADAQTPVEGSTPAEATELIHPRQGLFDPEPTAFDQGDTLGERPAEHFGWSSVPEEQSVLEPAVAVEAAVPSPRMVRSLDTLIEAVLNSEMSAEQITAVTDLVRGVADAIEDQNRS